MGAKCDAVHYLVVIEVRERLAVSKQAAQKFDVERFRLRKFSALEVRKKSQINIRNRFAALENLNDKEDINKVWENIKENLKTSAKGSVGLCGLKQHKPWFDEECLRLVDQRKRAKFLWLQDPKQSNVDNINNVRREKLVDILGTKEDISESQNRLTRN